MDSTIYGSSAARIQEVDWQHPPPRRFSSLSAAVSDERQQMIAELHAMVGTEWKPPLEQLTDDALRKTHFKHCRRPNGVADPEADNVVNMRRWPNGHAGGGIPFVITRDMKQALADLGHSLEQIRGMTPQDAHGILTASGWVPAPSSGIGQGPEGLRQEPSQHHPRTPDWLRNEPPPEGRGPGHWETWQGDPSWIEDPPELEVFDAGLDVEKPPPRGWLLANQFCRKFLSSLVAPGATGKSALRYAQLAALATGKPLTGEHIFVRCRVLLVSLEDDVDEIRRRIEAVVKHFGIKREELQGWMFYAAPKKMKLAQSDMAGNGIHIGALERALRRQIEANRIDLVMLDPFVKAHGLEENNNNAMDFVCDLLASLAIEYDVAVDVPHHARKGTSEPGDADLGRGGSAIRDAARLVYTLTAMGVEEAPVLGVPVQDRKLYVRLDNAKVNLVPGSTPVAWFRLVDVSLGNASETYPAGDHVPTVVRWKPEGMWSGITDSDINKILDEIDRGLPNGQRFSRHSTTGDKQPWTVVVRQCPDRTPEQAKVMVKAWLQSGLLYEGDYEDPVSRRSQKCLMVNPAKRPGTTL